MAVRNGARWPVRAIGAGVLVAAGAMRLSTDNLTIEAIMSHKGDIKELLSSSFATEFPSLCPSMALTSCKVELFTTFCLP